MTPSPTPRMQPHDANLRQVFEQVPYFRRFRDVPWEEVPLMNKGEMRRAFPDLLCVESDAEKRFLLDTVAELSAAGGPRREIERRGYVFQRTSGTTGVPLWIPRRRVEARLTGLATWTARCRIAPWLTPANFRAVSQFVSGTPAALTADQASRILWLNVGDVPFRSDLEIAALATKYPSVKIVEYVGGYVENERADSIERRQGWTVLSQYGCMETSTIAHGRGNVYSALPSIRVEIVDDRGRIVTEPAVEGFVHLTALGRHVLPVIRYNTGDLAAWADADRTTFRLLPLRRCERIRLRDGELHAGREIIRSIITRLTATHGELGISRIRLVQHEPHRFTLYVNASARPELATLFEQTFRAINLFGRDVLVSRRDAAELNDGKTVLFVSQCHE